MKGPKYKSEEYEYLKDHPEVRAASLAIPGAVGGSAIGAALAKFLLQRSALKGAGIGALVGGGLGAINYRTKPSAYRKDTKNPYESWDE